MNVEPGIYEHFKGQRYEVFGTTRHSETEEVFVSYRKLYDDYSYWVRPVEMFTGRSIETATRGRGSGASCSPRAETPRCARTPLALADPR